MEKKNWFVFSMILALLVFNGCDNSKDSGSNDDGSGGTGAVDQGPEGGSGGNPTDDDPEGGSGGENSPDEPVGGTGGDGSGELEVPEVYEFQSNFIQGESGVRYNGQTHRHILIANIKEEATALDAETASEMLQTADQVEARLYSHLCFGKADDADGQCPGADFRTNDRGVADQADRAIFYVPSGLERGDLLQQTYGDISSSDLIGKLAGIDSNNNPEDYWVGENFVGWQADGVNSPESLLHWYFDQIIANAQLRFDGTERELPFRPADGEGSDEVLPIFVSEDGLDYQQLINKFLLGAVAFHQAADDYMDNDPSDGEGNKGLLSPNTQKGDAVYSSLEHVWDEGFGYFGAARDYNDYTDDEIAASSGRPEYANGYHDTNGDGDIDFKSELNFGASVNAAKRDRGSNAAARTDFTQQAIDAFLKGRAIIHRAASRGGDGALSAQEMEMLVEERDKAISAWEKAISATAVHYINDVIQDMNMFEEGQAEQPNFSFRNLAKHWSEMKGFALSFQFNPRSPMHEVHMDGPMTRNQKFHELVGTRPVVPSSEDNTYPERADYIAALLEAREILQAAYEFAPENMGDENGENGW